MTQKFSNSKSTTSSIRMDTNGIRRFLKMYRKLIVIIVLPLATSVIPLTIQTKSANCAFVAILMIIFWITEALPIAVTSFLPVLLFPLLGILPSEKVAVEYFKDIIMLFLAGIIVAMSIEMTNLHKRIALLLFMGFGSEPKWVMLGLMLITAFMSLWISNTATTAMMLPIISAVVNEIITDSNKIQIESDVANEKTQSTQGINSSCSQYAGSVAVLIDDQVKPNNSINKDSQKFQTLSENGRKINTGFLLACSYSASIGGMGTLVGTPTNVLAKGFYDENLPKAHLTFLSFMLYALPVCVIMILVSWLWLSIRWLPKDTWLCCKKKPIKSDIKSVVNIKYEELGSMTWAEKCVLTIFLILVTLWLTRDLIVVPGWSYLFEKGYTSDTTPCVLAVFLLFMCPDQNIFKGRPYSGLVKWKALQEALPWSVLFLTGGSLALSQGFQASNLSEWIGEQLKKAVFKQKEVTLIIITFISAFTTEFASNTSIEAIFLPIVHRLAIDSNINPNYLLLPMTLSVSLAFMLPVATPTNAIVFSTGKLRMIDMVTSGIMMNIIGLSTIFLASNTWLGLIFDLNQFNLNNQSSISSLPLIAANSSSIFLLPK